MGFFDKIFDSKETSIEESCVVCNDKINDLIDKYNYFYYDGKLKNANDGGDYSDDERKAWKYTKLIGHFRRKKVCWFCQHALTNLKGFGGWNEELTPHWEGIVKGNESKYYRQTIKNKAGNIVSEYEIINETNTDILFDYVKAWYTLRHDKEIEDAEKDKEYQKQRKKEAEEHDKFIRGIKSEIKALLIEKGTKITVSDIDAFLKHQDVDEIKELCEEMYQNGEISFAGNGRYFILTEEKEKPKKTSAPKSEEVDVEKELEKLKALLDKGLITQEQYDAKSNELLGL